MFLTQLVIEKDKYSFLKYLLKLTNFTIFDMVLSPNKQSKKKEIVKLDTTSVGIQNQYGKLLNTLPLWLLKKRICFIIQTP